MFHETTTTKNINDSNTLCMKIHKHQKSEQFAMRRYEKMFFFSSCEKPFSKQISHRLILYQFQNYTPPLLTFSTRAMQKPSESNEETGRDSIDRDFEQNGNVEYKTKIIIKTTRVKVNWLT